MRKLVLGILFSLWSQLALAGINCPLPFTLTNGTTADATQVMANYNALGACLGNAAAAGANTDITALLGMTTPLGPASGGSSWFLGGTSTGSANAQSVGALIPNSYVLINKSFVAFIAGFTNNTATTLNIGNTGPINVVAHTQAGLVNLQGGEIVATQATVVYYDGTQYQLFDASPQGLVNPCTEIDYAGVSTPSGYLLENGAAVSRTGFPNLFSCLTTSIATSTVSGNNGFTNTGSITVQQGWFVGGNNVVCNSIVTSVSGTSVFMNNNATGNGATTLTVGPEPQGDCSTTFTLPDQRGRASVGADGTGGIINFAACNNSGSIGASCGSVNQITPQSSLPTATLPVTITGAGTATGTASGQTTSGYSPLVSGAAAIAVATGASASNYTVAGAGQLFPVTAFNNLSGFSSLNVTAATVNSSVTVAGSGNTGPMGSGSAYYPIPMRLVTKAIKF